MANIGFKMILEVRLENIFSFREVAKLSPQAVNLTNIHKLSLICW